MDESCVKGLKELEKGITCFICQKHYTEPKILPSPCLHYYCKECVLQTVSSNKFSCPQDGINSTLPKGGVEELETAFFISLFKSRLLALKQVYDETEVTCKECHFKSKAESFCYHCEVFICNNCVLSHEKLKLFTSHEVVSLEDLKKSQAKAMTVRATKKCIVHGEPLLIYCFDCDSLICRDCTMIDHKNHKSQFINVASSETKKDLLKELVPYREVSAKLSSAVETISITKQEVEAQGESVVKNLETLFQELIQILKKRKEELVQEATAKVDKKLEKLSVQENELSLALCEVQSVIKYTERLVDNCSDNEVMSMHVGVKNQIQAGMTEHSKSGRSLEPVEEVDMGVEVKIGKALELLCRNEAKINLLAIDPAQCTVRGKGVESAVVNCTAKVTLTANILTNSKATRRNVSVVGELKSLCNDTVVEGCVNELRAGRYEILYRPIVRGHHELCVTVDGKAVAGNPFPVFVSISPFDLGKPVHIWDSITKPRGITVNSENDIIVAEKFGDIFKLNKKGEKTILVKYSNTKLTELESIATDSEDNIYCTDYKSNKVMKCDKNGCEVKVHEIEQLTDRGSPGHWVCCSDRRRSDAFGARQ